MKVEIAKYNPNWPAAFQLEKQLLTTLIGKSIHTIEHIGSTSVPDLAAKPIIDVMVGLKEFSTAADAAVIKLTQQNYHYFPQFEDQMPNRRFFKKNVEGQTTAHIHMTEFKDEFWQRHLLFRDYLRANPKIANQYAQLKMELAKKDWPDSNDFADAKTNFIRKIEKQAMTMKNDKQDLSV